MGTKYSQLPLFGSQIATFPQCELRTTKCSQMRVSSANLFSGSQIAHFSKTGRAAPPQAPPRKPRKWASEPIAPPTALVWPHPLSQPSHCIEALPTHVLSAVPRSLTTCDIMSMLCKHAVAAAPVQEATAVGGLVCIALNVTGSLVILEASADASWWPTVRLLNGSVLGAVGSSCAWLSFYPHVVWR